MTGESKQVGGSVLAEKWVETADADTAKAWMERTGETSPILTILSLVNEQLQETQFTPTKGLVHSWRWSPMT